MFDPNVDLDSSCSWIRLVRGEWTYGAPADVRYIGYTDALLPLRTKLFRSVICRAWLLANNGEDNISSPLKQTRTLPPSLSQTKLRCVLYLPDPPETALNGVDGPIQHQPCWCDRPGNTKGRGLPLIARRQRYRYLTEYPRRLEDVANGVCGISISYIENQGEGNLVGRDSQCSSLRERRGQRLTQALTCTGRRP